MAVPTYDVVKEELLRRLRVLEDDMTMVKAYTVAAEQKAANLALRLQSIEAVVEIPTEVTDRLRFLEQDADASGARVKMLEKRQDLQVKQNATYDAFLDRGQALMREVLEVSGTVQRASSENVARLDKALVMHDARLTALENAPQVVTKKAVKNQPLKRLASGGGKRPVRERAPPDRFS